MAWNPVMDVQNTMLEMVRGDTFEFTMEFDDLAADLSSALFTIKNGSSNLVQLSIGDGITKIGTGIYDVKMSPADTASKSPGRYPYDLEITTADGEVYTILIGWITILQDYS